MTLEEVKQFLEENKDQEEVKSYVEGLSQVTSDGVNDFLETDEGKKFIQPKLDKYHAKSLESWKKKNLDSLVDEEVKTRFPEKDPKDNELEKLTAKIEKMEREKVRDSLTNKAMKYADEQKLPVGLVDYFVSEDEETTNQNLETFQNVWNKSLQTMKEQLIKDNGIDPKDSSHDSKSITREQLEAMSTEEISQLNDDVVNAALSNNQ